MDCSPPGSSVHGILQARILEWVAIPFSRRSSPPRDQTQVSHTAGDSLPSEPPGKPFSRICVTSYKEPKTSAEKHPLANGRIQVRLRAPEPCRSSEDILIPVEKSSLLKTRQANEKQMLGFGGVKNVFFLPFLPNPLRHSRQRRRELKQHLLNAYHTPVTVFRASHHLSCTSLALMSLWYTCPRTDNYLCCFKR